MLDTKDLSPLTGIIARLVRSRVRVEFGLDEDEKGRLLTELTKLHDPINLEDL